MNPNTMIRALSLGLFLIMSVPGNAQTPKPTKPQVDPSWPNLKLPSPDTCTNKCEKLCEKNQRCLNSCIYVCRSNEKNNQPPPRKTKS
jgi:hypothetical protein